MKSMTGYGAGRAEAGAAEISVVVKAVNGRFLETRFHLPKEYFALESQLKKILAATFRRGTVDVFVYRRGSSGLSIKLNRDVAKKWVKAHKELAQELGLPVQNAGLLERLSTLPQIFDVRDEGELHNREKTVFLRAFRQALERCDAEKTREGQAIRVHLRKVLKSLRETVAKIEKLRGQVSHELEERLRDRFRKLGLEGQVEPGRFAQELVIHLDKSDVAEEVERLKEHVHMCERYLSSASEHGKKFDFYSQELLREVNTIGSKANSARLTEQVVLAKGLIEAFKEQVQNIE